MESKGPRVFSFRSGNFNDPCYKVVITPANPIKKNMVVNGYNGISRDNFIHENSSLGKTHLAGDFVHPPVPAEDCRRPRFEPPRPAEWRPASRCRRCKRSVVSAPFGWKVGMPGKGGILTSIFPKNGAFFFWESPQCDNPTKCPDIKSD